MIDRKKLGRSGLTVPGICLGTMTFGQQNDTAQSHAQLDYALERGVDFVDTAEMYSMPIRAETFGATEKIVGEWLVKGKRDRVTLASKVSGPGRGMDWIRTGDREGVEPLSKRDVLLSCEASLKRLRTDYLDLYQIHWPTRNVPIFGAGRFDPSKDRECASIRETLEGLAQLVKDGKVRAVGVSNETPWGVCEWTKIAEHYSLPRIASIQNVYNLMSREFDAGVAEACHREDVGLLVYSALAFGHLTGKYLRGVKPADARLIKFGPLWPRYARPQIEPAVLKYEALAKDAGLTLTQLALAFCYRSPYVASTILGATSVEQLREQIDAWSTPLSDDLIKAIDAIHEQMPNPAK